MEPSRFRETWIVEALDAAEAIVARGAFDELRDALAKLPHDLFILLYFDRLERWPRLKAWLPPLPSEADQRLWTGLAAFDTMRLATVFLDDLFTFANAGPDVKVLDYGCGWGRMLRLLYNRARVSNIYGADPLDASLEHLRTRHVHANLEKVAFQPTEPPFNGTKFDIIYAFSVFTHIGPTSQNAILSALRRCIADDGVLAITTRQGDFWERHPWPDEAKRKVSAKAHFAGDIAFHPHEGKELHDYGEASIPVDYMRKHWKEWRVDGVEWRAVDEHQLIAYLRPA